MPAKTKISAAKLSKAVAPFIKAMDFVHAIISERDEAIAKMERMGESCTTTGSTHEPS